MVKVLTHRNLSLIGVIMIGIVFIHCQKKTTDYVCVDEAIHHIKWVNSSVSKLKVIGIADTIVNQIKGIVKSSDLEVMPAVSVLAFDTKSHKFIQGITDIDCKFGVILPCTNYNLIAETVLCNKLIVQNVRIGAG